MKLLENTFRHVNIALVNELAMFAAPAGRRHLVGDRRRRDEAVRVHAFQSGAGRRRPLPPIDPSYLAWHVERRLGHPFRFVELANEVNRGMPDYVVSRVITLLNEDTRAVKASRILLLGLSYKPGTSDWRESPARTIAQRLHALGAELHAHDPYVPLDADLGVPVTRVACDTAELEAADLVVAARRSSRPPLRGDRRALPPRPGRCAAACGPTRSRASASDGALSPRATRLASPAMLDHVSIQCADPTPAPGSTTPCSRRSAAAACIEFGPVIGYGRPGRPTFWIGPLSDDVPNRENHIAFDATDRAAVRAFFDAAVAAGAEALHAPRVWPEYHPNYYGAFVRDPDGNNVEAVCHSPEA